MKASEDTKYRLLAFAVIDAVVYALLAEPLGLLLPIQPVWLNNLVHRMTFIPSQPAMRAQKSPAE